jgi:hypothetical protein
VVRQKPFGRQLNVFVCIWAFMPGAVFRTCLQMTLKNRLTIAPLDASRAAGEVGDDPKADVRSPLRDGPLILPLDTQPEKGVQAVLDRFHRILPSQTPSNKPSQARSAACQTAGSLPRGEDLRVALTDSEWLSCLSNAEGKSSASERR